MRVIRSLLPLLAVAFAAAACALQPAAWGPATPAPVAMRAVAPAAPVSGIDTTVYGAMAQAEPPPASAPAASGQRGLFMAAAAPASAAVPAADGQRGLFMAAAAPPPAARPAPAPRNAAAQAMAHAPAPEHKPYTLDSGDRLRIVVFGQDGLSNAFVVDASGYIDMPLIGSVLARGATTDELSGRIADKLRQGYVKEPHVAVEVEAYRPFFILGEVTQPGQYPYVADMTAETAVAIAGGFGPRAYRQTVTVTRIVRGQQVRMTVPPSFPLRPGDTVNVQERWF